jgi:hypothetical protein
MTVVVEEVVAVEGIRGLMSKRRRGVYFAKRIRLDF